MLRACLLIALAALPAPPLCADDAEDAAVKLVNRLGGKVSRDATAVGKAVVVVSLDKTKVTDDDLKEVAVLKGVRVLNLFGTGVTDAGLKHLSVLERLEGLDLRETKVTSDGLKNLEGMKRLKSLFLPGVRAAAVKELKKALPDCRVMTEAGGS